MKGITEAISDVTEQPDRGESAVDQLFDHFASALAQLAREKTDTFLSSQGENVSIAGKERIVLDLVAGHEVIEAMGTALRLAPQGSLTQDLYPTIVRHQSDFTKTANAMFPEDPHREETLAKLVRALRASLHPTPRR